MVERSTHLMTFLGTGNYQRVCYEWMDGRRCETQLFPTALPQFLPEISSATAFVTDESQAKHGARLDAEWPAQWRPRHVLIPKGSSADELWTIFDRVVAAVPPDSRVVFDITHAFRSIPLISVLAVAYLWSTRDVQLHALVYGAYEAASGTPPVAPVFDLTPMVNLLEWIAAVERFRHHLDGEPLQRMLQQIQRQAHQRQAALPPTQLQNAGNAVKRLTDALLLGRVREVLRETPVLAATLEKPELRDEAVRWAKPLLLMLEPLQAVLREIGQGPVLDLAAHRGLAQFYNNRRLYPLAITLLREWIVSEACRRAGVPDSDLFDEQRREEVERVLGDCYVAMRDKQPLPTEPVWVQKLADDGLLELWNKVPGIRNDIDHAGMRRSPQAADRLILNVRGLFAQ
jgi:CRISPR-associated DxTHG motif protein